MGKNPACQMTDHVEAQQAQNEANDREGVGSRRRVKVRHIGGLVIGWLLIARLLVAWLLIALLRLLG